MTAPDDDAKLNPQAIRLLRIISENPGYPGTWEGFPRNIRGSFRTLEILELASFTTSDGWTVSPKGAKVVEDFKPLPRPKVKR